MGIRNTIINRPYRYNKYNYHRNAAMFSIVLPLLQVGCRSSFWGCTLLLVGTYLLAVNYYRPFGSFRQRSVEYKVPNIVHYIWYPGHRIRLLSFHHMLSIVSAYQVLRPDVIYFHTDRVPTGRYWEAVRQIPTFTVMHRAPPTELFGKKLAPPAASTSHSNVDRLLVLREYGGIYLDMDVLVTGSFDQLRRHECTLGYEANRIVCGGIIVCSNRSEFLSRWLDAYRDDYRPKEWGYNSGVVPSVLAKRYSELIHIEPQKLHRPNWKELDFIVGRKTFDWRGHYAVHLWKRNWRSYGYQEQEADCDNIKTMANTFGQIARRILYGTSAAIIAGDATTRATGSQGNATLEQKVVANAILASDLNNSRKIPSR